MLAIIIIPNERLISLKLEFNSNFKWDSMFDYKMFFFVLKKVFFFEPCGRQYNIFAGSTSVVQAVLSNSLKSKNNDIV